VSKLPFATYDVFTDTRFAGNPLAVVFEADALSDAQMQAIAREFNLSETIFVRQASIAQHEASVRIFTPGKELPFAGHPTIGCAIALAEARHAAAGPRDILLVLEERIGPVRCAVKIAEQGESFVFDQAWRTHYVPGPCDVALGVREDMGRGLAAQLLYPVRALWRSGAAQVQRTRVSRV